MDPTPPSATPAVSGRVVRVLHQDEARGFSVFDVMPEDGATFTAVGGVSGLVEGLDVRLTGSFRDNPRFGRQFRATTVLVLPPERPAGLLAYLASGEIPGIGKELAARIVAHFGEGTRAALDGGPQFLREVPGIGPARAASIAEAWARQRARRETFVLLCGMGLTASQAARVIKAWGEEAPARVRRDPYALAHVVHGFGFRTADAIATGLGIAPDSPVRLRAALLDALSEAAESGHLFLDAAALTVAAADRTGRPDEELADVIVSLVAEGRLASDPGPAPDGTTPGPLFYESGLYQAEVRAARRLCELAAVAVPPLALPPARADGDAVTLAPSQARALAAVLASAVSVLTGGPGTGKTTVVGSLLAAADRAGLRVVLAAPTGRAAMRMKEATGREARTLHRLLEYNPHQGGFQRCEALPIEADWVVVDEASMLDARMLDHLLRAVATGTRVTFVGDADQLPPVGPGDPFREIIASGRIPVARLTEVFRQGAGSGIVDAAHRILHGESPLPDRRERNEDGLADFYLVEREDPADLARMVETLVCERIPARFGLDPLRDIQVLAPMHRGECGTTALNAALRARLVPGSAGRAGFVPGDRVLQIRNNYDLDVFNGDIGIVQPGGEGVRVRFDDREVVYGAADVDDLVPAYAISVHKSQGSEFPAVVVVLHTQHYVMLRRNLLYTAVTRGRRLVCLCGSRRAIRLAVADDRVERRNSLLSLRLRTL